MLGGRLYRLEFENHAYLWSVKRPYTDMFIRYVMDNFGKVVVWSAGTSEYVHKIVDWLFTESYPDMIFSRDFCSKVPSAKDPSKDTYVKPIIKLGMQPELKGVLRLDNTLFIDDNVVSTSYNSSNAITIPRYHPEIRLESIINERDDALKRIVEWCDSGALKQDEDVRKINKSSTAVFSPQMRTGHNILLSETYASQNIYV